MTSGAPALPPVPTTPVLSFVILDRTNGSVPWLAPGTTYLPMLADALQAGLRIFAAFHGGPYAVRLGAGPDDRQPGEVAVNLRHSQSDDPSGALAWHTVTNGVPDVEIPVDLTSGPSGDSEALDVCASHEVFEAARDPGGNGWKDTGAGKTSAEEACDRVEDTFFAAPNGLHLSNFLLEAAWVPGAPPPYDYLQVLETQTDDTGSASMTPGGYDVEATAPSDAEDVVPGQARAMVRLGSKKQISVAWLKRKAMPHSRTARRQKRTDPRSLVYRHVDADRDTPTAT